MNEVRFDVLRRLNQVSLARPQMLVLVLQYYLHVGDTVQAWNLTPLAARLGFALLLNGKRPDLDHLTPECHRWLVRAIFTLDRLFSGISYPTVLDP